MQDTVRVGQIGGVPVGVHFTFICLLLIWGQHGLTSGLPQQIAATLVILAALTGSIVLHELGHAFAGRLFGLTPEHIALHGMGGSCHWSRSRLLSREEDIVVSLAGPLANLLIYAVCDGITHGVYLLPKEMVESDATLWALYILNSVGSANFALFWFNLLPAHPLDGGHIAAALIGRRTDGDTARLAVAWSGLGVAALVAGVLGRGSGFSLAIALMLAYENGQVIMSSSGRPPWQRWN